MRIRTVRKKIYINFMPTWMTKKYMCTKMKTAPSWKKKLKLRKFIYFFTLIFFYEKQYLIKKSDKKLLIFRSTIS